jgi:hypothetical protein
MKIVLVFCACLVVKISIAQKTTIFEKSNGQQTPTYSQVIEWWRDADKSSQQIKMLEMGPSDAGFPLHLVIISKDKDFDIASLKKKNRLIILVNNGIHPGEPDGIDASMLLAKKIVAQPALLPDKIVLAIIPLYNIGGALNRSANYRVDQNGPEEFGFRGNSQNLDLNRDFIKCDSKEALTFTKIFHYLDPDIFIDNHVSNGADYQHVMTLIASQHNRLGGEMGNFMVNVFEPGLYQSMKTKGYDLVPYVNHFGETPDKGWSEFWDSPRYSSGYASLWNSFAFVPETHMLKPYRQRVESTLALMESFIEFSFTNHAMITSLRSQAKKQVQSSNYFPIAWKLDKSKSKEITYKGYSSVRKPSEVSGLPRLFYDRSKPYELRVPFYNVYNDTFSIQKPEAYIIPQGWWKVIDRLQANHVRMRRISMDTTIEVQSYKIEAYQSGMRPFEGHHLNTNVKVIKSKKTMTFRKGDYFIPLNQIANRFLIETLEPQAEDSYFTWNFFDPILGQKEGYSDYHFEDIAADYLKNNPALQEKLKQRILTDSAFAKNGGAQLNFVYQNSPWFEPSYMQYPVYSIVK